MQNILEELMKELTQGKDGNSVLRDLYYGRIKPWENKPMNIGERTKLNNKIESLVRYFEESLSPDDRERFEELCKLGAEQTSHMECDAFEYGFRLGSLIMVDVFTHSLGAPGRGEQK